MLPNSTVPESSGETCSNTYSQACTRIPESKSPRQYHERYLGDDENVLKLDRGDSCTTVNLLKIIELYI